MMQHMCANVMVDLVEDAIVSVNGRQASPQVTPLLQTHEYCVTHQCLHCCQLVQLMLSSPTVQTQLVLEH